jgi:hypothetical protein
MCTLLLKTILIGTILGSPQVIGGISGGLSAQAADAQSPGTISERPEPCYVIIAVDVSGNMESSDAPVSDSTGRRQTLRDEGQLIFLQLLPFLRSDLYVGVAHFSDRVRYALPSEQTGPLLSWGQTFLTESACRNLVRPAEFQGAFRTDISESMSWASGRIAAARRQYGDGPAKLIILSNGDPRDSARELDRGRGPLLSAARRFAEQRIQVYPVLINSASVRSTDRQARLSAQEIAAEDLMHSIASMTGGRAYRLAREFSFAEILLDVFGLGMQVRDDLLVSRHDWAIVAVGEPLASATVTPADAGPRALTMDNSLEAVSGIRANTITSPRYQTTVLRRPETGDLVDRFWQGKWQLGPADGKSPPAVRIYRIPDFLVQLELGPELPWWLHEQVQVRARLLERHRKAAGPPATAPAASGQDLSIHVRVNSPDETSSMLLAQGRWTAPARLYETEVFTIGTPGLYKLSCELRHAIGDAHVSLLRLSDDVYVHSECVGIRVVSAATGELLGEVPPTAAATLNIDVPGGHDVQFQIVGKGEFKVTPLAGTLHLEPLTQTAWPLRADERGSLMVGPVRLVEQEERLTGWAELDVRTHAGVRRIRLPRFDLAYRPAPMRIACTFTDPREALWVGEFHRQPLVISAFPVFDRFRDAILQQFPEALSQARIRTVDMRSGTMQATGPESRLLERPQTQGHEGTTVAATYFVESAIPVPMADRFEIDLGPAMENLQGTIRTYAVVDPVAQGLFRWAVTQPGQPQPRPGAVSETLFCGEPVQFHAEWRADQNISAVRFEFPPSESDEPVFVDLPVAAGANKAEVEQAVSGLHPGQNLPVYVHVTMQPAGADRPLQIKLRGGQFRAEDRRIILEALTVGEGSPADIAAYAWEPVEIPLRVVFSSYVATDSRHHAAIEQFKRSCVVVVTSRTGEARDISDTIEWTSVTPSEGPARRCELIGRAVYTPDTPGRATVDLSAETPAVQGASKLVPRRAYAHVLARTPRLAVTIRRLTPTGEESVFDSRRWSTGEGGVSALFTRFSARLRVDVRSNDWTATGQSRPWQTTIRLLRRPASTADWIAEFSDTGELTADGSFLREVQLADNGEYALEVTGYDSQSGRRTMFFLTPTIALIRPHEVLPAVSPPAWLTSRVRQWPFAYQVTLQQEAAEAGPPQALAFQFQLPGQTDTWMEGTASSIQSQRPEERQLLVRGPRFLPAARELRDGRMQFRLSSQGLELLRWECPDIRVIPPVLERLTLSHRSDAGPIDSSIHELTFDGSSELWVRPQFRAAPELEGQWVPSESTVYLWRRQEGESAGGPVGVRAIERLRELDATGAPRSDVRAFPTGTVAGTDAVQVMARRPRLALLGWPRPPSSDRYSLAACVVYRPRDVSDAAGAGAMPVSDRTIAEWSDIYTVQLNTPWIVPVFWWPVAALLVVSIVAAVLRLFVPNPSRLALDMRLEENVAVVEPVRLDNPVLVDLQETSLTRDVQLYTRYLASCWNQGAFKQGLALIVAPIRVLLRRALYPRRWAWAAVIPRIRGDARHVRTGLMCVWTGPGARGGRLWSCHDGVHHLPQEGQVKAVHLDLPYRMDNVDRTMRVTVRIRRTTNGAETSNTRWQEAGSEFHA